MKYRQKLKFISLGCAKALVDSEKLMGALKRTDYDLTDEPEEADTIIINTTSNQKVKKIYQTWEENLYNKELFSHA